MSDLPSITVSTADYNRIYAFIDGMNEKTPAIRALENELERADIVEDDSLPADVVRMNSQVRFLNEKTGREYTVKLVFPDATGDSDELASIFSAAGSAMIGLRVGDSINWPVSERNTLSLKLMEIIS